MRGNLWLVERLDFIRKRYFSDIPLRNHIEIRFGRKAKTRLGSIRQLKNGSSLIIINGHFIREEVPVYVVDAVIGHEFTHYCHGFQSDHPKLHKFPHLGGVVTGELKGRGLGESIKKQHIWIKKSWRAFLKTNHPKKRRVRKKKSKYFLIFKIA